MGGKTAVAAALRTPHALEKLVVTNFAPAAGAMLPELAAYVDVMARVQEMGLRSRKNAQVVLRETESVGQAGARAGTRADDTPLSVRGCTRLRSREQGGRTMRSQLPLDILGTSMDHVGVFPFARARALSPGSSLSQVQVWSQRSTNTFASYCTSPFAERTIIADQVTSLLARSHSRTSTAGAEQPAVTRKRY
jgi:hypothetical protein